MEKIESFQKDHIHMKTGFSLSGIDQGISTFDLRFKKPNSGDYLSNAIMHTVEHLLATLLRNSENKLDIVYFGPMGCRTGFYLLTRNITTEKAKALVADCIVKALEFKEVPGNKKEECGNYLEHDLAGAKRELSEYLKLL